MNEALRLAECIDFPSVHLGHEAATELRRLHDLLGKANALCRIRAERIKELEALKVELVEALQSVVAWMDAPDESAFSDTQLAAARVALANAEAIK